MIAPLANKKTRRRTPPHGTHARLGIVNSQIYGGNGKASALPTGKLINMITVGLPVKELEDLQASLDIPMEKLAPKLGISIATIQRRKQQGQLAPEESDRVWRFARLVGKAVAVFGNEEDARQWLTSAQFGLGGAAPLDYAKTEVGAREVENLLGRIEHGVYS